MQPFLETVFQLDDSGNMDELLAFIQSKAHDPDEMVLAVWQLLSKGGIRSAFAIAMLLSNMDRHHPAISMALSAGGLTYNTPDEATGRDGLRAHANALSEDQQAMFHKQVITPVMTNLLEGALQGPDNPQILRILEILKAAVPRLQTVFDLEATAPDLSMQTMRQRGQSQARLRTYPSPPTGAPRPQRRALVTGRDTFFLRPESRTSDIGPRIVAAMNAYGWQTTFHGISKSDAPDECHAIVERCRQTKPDILFLDDELLVGITQTRTEMIAQVRREHPSIKVVGYLIDAWSNPTHLKESATLLDKVWDTSPSLPIWQDPALAHKMLHIPFPLANFFDTPHRPLIPRMLFAGSVNLFNWHRAFWLAAIDRLKLPITRKVSTHAADGLPPLESYGIYMQNLAESTCCLNLSMRPDHALTSIVTGRCYETMHAGALLVQEASEDMRTFFIAGEHYLEFSSLAELAAVARFITHNRAEAEEIRRCGHAFARERYCDEKLIGYIDASLYFSA